MSDPAGKLNIQLLRTREGLVCRIASTRPVTAAAMFAGRAPADTAALLPMLFSICAKAQACASVTALELADGRMPPPDLWARRQLVVATETIREHLWRILLDWPHLLDETADRATMATLLSKVRDLFGASDPDGRLFLPGTQRGLPGWGGCSRLLADIDEVLARRVFGMHAERWLDCVADGKGFAQWCAATDTCAARLMRGLIASGEAALGQSAVAGLPDIGDAELFARLDAPDGVGFIAQPTWEGIPRETSPFTRHADRGLIRDLVAIHGRGLLARLSAQLLDVAILLAEIRNGPERFATNQPERAALEPGVGIGRANAARGLLVHLTRVERGMVTDYRILAPTEWNFHPQGGLALGLASLPDADDSVLRRRAELLIMATDPCVAFELSLPLKPRRLGCHG